MIIDNGWKPLTIITKRSILDIAAVLDSPLEEFVQKQWRRATAKLELFTPINARAIKKTSYSKTYISHQEKVEFSELGKCRHSHTLRITTAENGTTRISFLNF